MRGVGVRTAFAGYEEVEAVRSGDGVDEVPLIPWTEAGYLEKLTFTQFVIYLVGFSEGLTHLAALAIYYLLKDDLGLSPPEVSAIFIAPALPWVFKPFFAFLSDTFAVFGYRRKPYMIVFSTLEAIGFLMLGLAPASLCAAFCSAVAEALVVESTTGKTLDQSAENVSDFITAKAVGSLAVAYLSGYLLEKTSKGSIFVATATFPLFITFISFFMNDVTTPPARDFKAQFRELSTFLKQPVIWGPALYIFIYMAGPDYDDALFFFFSNKLGFSPTFMGTLRFTYGIAALLGVVLYRFVFRQAGFRQTLFWTIIVSLPIYISPVILVTGFNHKLGISNQAFVLSGGVLIEATAEIQLLPLLVLTASICPPGLEGSVYGMMMSIRNSGSMVSRGLSALFAWAAGITATNFIHLSSYILLCGAWLLLPLFFLGFM
ncbi:putative folate/biopterin transporter [Besnoitia besnoiti]|uniref:Putative folate/biopterin transporter n=1 Tax=Besnoitia besnoiti TaxID=94643 RepID=A0A2A9MJC9_BESBE|nr:putative folate/biopterin transporter [Besnoitia besnoiti]PFH38648.1 putative folate/biopterin transporter [Besnoitia besnoiti]